MQMSKRQKVVFLGAAGLCVVSALLSLCLGAVKLTLGELWQAVLGGPSGTAGYIFWYSRLPRTCACLLAGAALSLAGCILQSVLGNKLASPGIIGVNAGAGLAVTICCAVGALSGWAISLASFGGAMAAVLVVVWLARKTGASRTTVILSGVAMNSMLGALRDAITVLVPETAMLSNDFRVGTFASVVPARLLPAGILIALAILIVLTLCNELDVLSLGEETAGSLGMSVKKLRMIFLLLAAVLAGASVSFAGLLGFVGLLIPHMARKLVGGESRYLLPASGLLGAGFVTLCDLASRMLFVPYELPVGILMSILGGPFFLMLLFKKKGGHGHA